MAASEHPVYTLSVDEKVAQVMIYTPSTLFWGDLIVKSMIRVNTWLRTNTVPDRIPLLNAKCLVTTGSPNARPASFAELHIAVPQILAIHLIPPGKEPLDYDKTEPNRKMEPVNALIGSFLMKGSLRLSTSANLKKFLEVTRENFTGLYDVEVTNLVIPNLGTLAVPFVLVRQETTVFTIR